MKNFIYSLLQRYKNLGIILRHYDGLAALGLRLYLVPIFWMAGTNKLMHFQDTVEWFGNSDWGLGLPFPTIMATLATSAELEWCSFVSIRFIYSLNQYSADHYHACFNCHSASTEWMASDCRSQCPICKCTGHCFC